MSTIKQIAEGWKNVILKDATVEEVAKIRLEICAGCSFQSENAKQTGYTTVRPDIHCTQCGCPLISKTRCMTCECPEKKWLPHDVEKS